MVEPRPPGHRERKRQRSRSRRTPGDIKPLLESQRPIRPPLTHRTTRIGDPIGARHRRARRECRSAFERPNAFNAIANRAEPAVTATPERPNRAESRCAGLCATNPWIRYAASITPQRSRNRSLRRRRQAQQSLPRDGVRARAGRDRPTCRARQTLVHHRTERHTCQRERDSHAHGHPSPARSREPPDSAKTGRRLRTAALSDHPGATLPDRPTDIASRVLRSFGQIAVPDPDRQMMVVDEVRHGDLVACDTNQRAIAQILGQPFGASHRPGRIVALRREAPVRIGPQFAHHMLARPRPRSHAPCAPAPAPWGSQRSCHPRASPPPARCDPGSTRTHLRRIRPSGCRRAARRSSHSHGRGSR